MKITEIKKSLLTGAVQKFACQALLWKQSNAILQHIWSRDCAYEDGPMKLPAGEIHTLALYWSDRNYLVYRLSDAGGNLFGYRVDACEFPHFSAGSLQWTDLVLDFWITAEGEFYVLDEEEFRQAVRSGKLTRFQSDRAREVQELLKRNPKALVTEVESLLESFL